MNVAYLISAAWSVLTVAFCATALWNAIWLWRGFRDERARREVVFGLALLFTASSAAVSLMLITLEAREPIRDFIAGMTRGGFLIVAAIAAFGWRDRR